MNWQLVAFFFLAGLTIYSAWRVVTDTDISHAALYLAVAFVGVAGFFALADAEFLAVVQVLVYAGAVMTLMVFAIMLSDMREIRGRPQPLVQRLSSPRWGFLPLALAAAVVVLLLAALADLPVPAAGARGATLAELARSLLTTYLLPFEVASLLLLVAMVGAIVMSRREEEVRAADVPAESGADAGQAARSAGPASPVGREEAAAAVAAPAGPEGERVHA